MKVARMQSNNLKIREVKSLQRIQLRSLMKNLQFKLRKKLSKIQVKRTSLRKKVCLSLALEKLKKLKYRRIDMKKILKKKRWVLLYYPRKLLQSGLLDKTSVKS